MTQMAIWGLNTMPLQCKMQSNLNGFVESTLCGTVCCHIQSAMD